MKNITNMDDMAQQWARSSKIKETRSISAPQLRRYAAEGLIRTSNICRPGQTRGTRLFNVMDLDKLIEASIQQGADVTSEVKKTGAGATSHNGASN